MAETGSELTVIFTPTEEDAVRLKFAVFGQKRIFLWGGIVAVVMLVLCLAGYLAQALRGGLKEWLAIPVFLVLVPLIFFVYIPWRLRQNIRKAFRNNPNARLETTYRFSSWRVSLGSAIGRKDLIWEAISEVLETKKDFIFFTSQQMAFICPKAALSSRDEQQRLRRIIIECAADRASLQTESRSEDRSM